jgi:hypothetical protein
VHFSSGKLLVPICLFAIIVAATPCRSGDTDEPRDLEAREEVLGDLAFLIGEWKIESKRYARSGEVIEENGGSTRFEWVLEGLRILEQATTSLGGQPMDVLNVYAFHPENKQWEMVRTDTIHHSFSIQVGTFDDGRLVLHRKYRSPDSDLTRRWTLQPVGEDRFSLLLEFSFDEGESWFRRNETWYTRTG